MQEIHFILPIAFKILKLKILKSDWPKAFLHLSQEPDFSQTCGFNRIIKVIMVQDFNPKNLHINGIFFCKILKSLFRGFFWALSPE